MVSYNVYKATSSGAYVEGVCLASDEKPVVGIANGSILFAVDASSGETTRYMYDKESMSWIEAECPCAGGGSGGSGGGGSSEGPLLVTLSGDDLTADKTFQEIFDAMHSGRGAVVVNDGSASDNVVQWFPFSTVEIDNEYSHCSYSSSMDGTVASANEGAAPTDYPYFGGGFG